MKKKIFIITGEASGDKLASKIVSYFDKKKYSILATGSENLKSKNIKLLFNSSSIAFMGIKDIFVNFFYIIKKINFTINSISKFKPNVIFSIDAPDFSFLIEKKIKKKFPNIKVVHLVAPSIWAWRESRAKSFRKFIDHMLLLFPFEVSIFNKWNIKNTFVGHPFFENKINYKKFFLPKNKKLITLCPGSRISEIKIFMPIFIKLISAINFKFNNNYIFHFPVPKNRVKLVKSYLSNKLEFFLSDHEDKKNFYIKNSILSVAKSGTISLDVCKNKCPLITIYKTSMINYFFIKPLVNVKYGNIINIAANKEIIPELIQNNCTVEKIFLLVCSFIGNKKIREQNVQNYSKILNTFKKENSNKIISDIIKSYC